MQFVPQNNLAYPVLIKAPKTTGSGFLCTTGTAVYLATAKHVLFERGLELFSDVVELTALGSDLTTKIEMDADCKSLLAKDLLRKHDKADVAVAKIGTLDGDVIHVVDGVRRRTNSRVSLVGMDINSTKKFVDVGISNQVILFAYPTSLGSQGQLDPSRPLLRTGIVAGKTEDGRIVIDCPVYFGNSGGLVIEIEDDNINRKFIGIGVAVEMIPFREELWSKQFKVQTGLRFENSGYSIIEPIDRIVELFS